jgi:hypothetical protein
MSKVIFKEVEYTEYDSLYDDDGIKEISGKNNALYVVIQDRFRRESVVNGKEFEELCSRIDEIIDDIENLKEGYSSYFRSYKHILEYYGYKYSPAAVKRLKTWYESYNGSLDDIAEFLTITTGEKWNTYGVCGYCQGDYATGIYCEGHYNDKALDLYVGAAAGTVKEFCRIEGNDICYGFYVSDNIAWNTDELKKELSSFEGDKPENITIQLFDGYTQTPKYTEV